MHSMSSKSSNKFSGLRRKFLLIHRRCLFTCLQELQSKKSLQGKKILLRNVIIVLVMSFQFYVIVELHITSYLVQNPLTKFTS